MSHHGHQVALLVKAPNARTHQTTANQRTDPWTENNDRKTAARQQQHQYVLSVTSAQMHDPTAGKVVEAVCAQPADRMPSPVGDDGVDEAGDHDGVDDVGDEVAPLGQGP